MEASTLRPANRTTPVVSTAAATFVGVIAASVLVGWIFDLADLKSPYGDITMKTNTAVGLLLCATGLWAHARRLRAIGIICGVAAAAIGTLTLAEHIFRLDLGIDQLLFTEPAGALATASPNRMGPNGATNLALAGTAILCLFRGTPRSIRWAQSFAVTGGVLVILALAGYIYGAEELYAIARYTGIALHTVVALLMLHIGILAARVDQGPMAIFVHDGPAGTMLRRLVAPVLLTPLIAGLLVIRGREAGLYDRGLSIAFFAVTLIVVFGSVVWHTATRIAVAEADRRRAEQDRDALLQRERQARDEAEHANHLKDQFLAGLSHELRTPLNVMLGWTSVLEADTAPERHARAAAVVARNGRILARLVEDLLDVSRVSAGHFEISRRPTALNPVVQAAVEALAPVAASKGVALRFSLDDTVGEVDGDPERLQQVVSNLVSNALKFTKPGGFTEVRTSADGGTLVLTVADNGIGFDATFASQMFQAFRQADSSFRREHGGLGLGLSIARHIAELHGGTLTGTSEGPGHGATFTLRLPRLVADQTQSTLSTAAESRALRT